MARLGRLVKNRLAEQMVAYPPTSGWCTSPKSGGSRGREEARKGTRGGRQETGGGRERRRGWSEIEKARLEGWRRLHK